MKMETEESTVEKKYRQSIQLRLQIPNCTLKNDLIFGFSSKGLGLRP